MNNVDQMNDTLAEIINRVVELDLLDIHFINRFNGGVKVKGRKGEQIKYICRLSQREHRTLVKYIKSVLSNTEQTEFTGMCQGFLTVSEINCKASILRIKTHEGKIFDSLILRLLRNKKNA